MSTITRSITVDTLDDIADFIAVEKKIYTDRFNQYVKHNESVKGAFTQKQIANAANIAVGLGLAESIVRDCQFASLIGKGEVVEKKDCTHGGYVSFTSQNYPYEVDRGPFCPACDEVVEL